MVKKTFIIPLLSSMKNSFRDEAIDLADKALNMTKEERIKQFSDLLNDAQITKNRSKNSRKSSIDKTDDIKKLRNRSPSFDLPTAQTLTENGNKNEVQPSIKKKRGRKPKIDHSPTDLTVRFFSLGKIRLNFFRKI